MGKYDFYKLRSLVHVAVGSLSAEEFAAKTGLNTEYVKKLLYSAYVARPAIATLDVLAQNLKDTDIAELMKICGYHRRYISDEVHDIEQIIDGFFMIRKDTTWRTDDLQKCLDIPKVSIRRVKHERVEHVSIDWDYDIYTCTTRFNVWYTRNTDQNVISSCDITKEIKKGGKIVPHTTIRNKDH